MVDQPQPVATGRNRPRTVGDLDRVSAGARGASIKKRIMEFEGARGLLALWVLVYHVFAITGVRVPAPLAGGHAVAVFFALSGFVIALLLSRARETYTGFVLRRWCRLFPAFAVTVCIGGALSHVGIMPDRTAPGTDWLHALAHLTMLHGVVPDDLLENAAGSFLNPAWSISVEWQFYLLVPLLAWATSRRPLLAWTAFFAAAAFGGRVAGAAELGGVSLFGGASLLANARPFTIGIASFAVFAWAAENGSSLAGHGSKIAFAIPLLLLSALPIAPHVGLLVWLSIFGVVLARSLDGERAAAPIRWASAVLASPGMARLGAASYSLYLIHEPVIWLARRGMAEGGLELDGWRLTLCVGMISLPVSIACAALLHRWVEVPGIAFGVRRLGPAERVERGPVADLEVARQASP